MPPTQPPASRPPYLMTSEPGSFARYTIVERKPQIIRQVIADNDYPAGIVEALTLLRTEIISRPMQPLREPEGEAVEWNAALAQDYPGKTWLEAPWYFAEAFFYRKLLEAVRYFQSGPWQGRDPFGLQKRRQERSDLVRLAGSLTQLAGLDLDEPALFEALVHAALWGNRADLSNAISQQEASGILAARQERHRILINDTPQVYELLSGRVERIDFINDNVGADLFFDLLLVDFLLARGWTQQVTLHLKARPLFVSDAMPADVDRAIELFRSAENTLAQALGQRLNDFLNADRLHLRADPFWTSHHMFSEFPPAIEAQLAQAALVVVKGDANYRRLLEDRHWPHTTRLEDVTGYFPTAFVALRTLKGEIMVGLRPGQTDQLSAEDPDWLINGKRGLIHFYPGAELK